jgi:hypothetical protein
MLDRGRVAGLEDMLARLCDGRSVLCRVVVSQLMVERKQWPVGGSAPPTNNLVQSEDKQAKSASFVEPLPQAPPSQHR